MLSPLWVWITPGTCSCSCNSLRSSLGYPLCKRTIMIFTRIYFFSSSCQFNLVFFSMVADLRHVVFSVITRNKFVVYSCFLGENTQAKCEKTTHYLFRLFSFYLSYFRIFVFKVRKHEETIKLDFVVFSRCCIFAFRLHMCKWAHWIYCVSRVVVYRHTYIHDSAHG